MHYSSISMDHYISTSEQQTPLTLDSLICYFTRQYIFETKMYWDDH